MLKMRLKRIQKFQNKKVKMMKRYRPKLMRMEMKILTWVETNLKINMIQIVNKKNQVRMPRNRKMI